MLTSFGARLGSAFEQNGRLCVGIDPHPYLLGEWGLPDSAAGLREFALRVVDASAGRVGILKPQVAFFERHGSAGIAALEEAIARARETGMLVIADAKRGDVGSSVEAYGQAWLRPGSPLESDALTVSAFQGVGSLDAVLALAHEHGKGLFVLAATSNPESARIQRAVTAEGVSVAAAITDEVVAWNDAHRGANELGSVGLVLGATLRLADFGIDPALLAHTPVLAPGFGHQGARVSELTNLYGVASGGVVVTASRSILAAGPEGLVAAIDAQRAELAGHDPDTPAA